MSTGIAASLNIRFHLAQTVHRGLTSNGEGTKLIGKVKKFKKSKVSVDKLE